MGSFILKYCPGRKVLPVTGWGGKSRGESLRRRRRGCGWSVDYFVHTFVHTFIAFLGVFGTYNQFRFAHKKSRKPARSLGFRGGWAGWNRTSTGRVKVCQDVAIYLAFLKSCTVRAQFYLYLSLEIFALPSSMSMCVYFCVVDTQAWPSMDCTARMLAPLASK